MTGTLAAILILAGTIGGMLLRGRHRDRGSTMIVATIVVGLLGYVVTGRPGLAEAPARWIGDDPGSTSTYETARTDLLTATGDTGAWLTFADALGRDGDTLSAIHGLERGIADHPGSVDLWIGLGEAFARHGDNVVGPAARLAFGHAIALEPSRPTATYFLGLALVRAGDPAAALQAWSAIHAGANTTIDTRLVADRAAAQAMVR